MFAIDPPRVFNNRATSELQPRFFGLKLRRVQGLGYARCRERRVLFWRMSAEPCSLTLSPSEVGSSKSTLWGYVSHIAEDPLDDRHDVLEFVHLCFCFVWSITKDVPYSASGAWTGGKEVLNLRPPQSFVVRM